MMALLSRSFTALALSLASERAKSKPGSINYGTSGAGTVLHLAAELLKTMAKIDLVHVPLTGRRARKADKNPAEAGSVSLLKRMRRCFLYEAALSIFAHHGHQLMASWG
jgi:hypothetical protein